ncbi:MAG: glycosyltransferase [Eubacterium sp.]|nr:glycosyltransferase [Eubacterium sp.]
MNSLGQETEKKRLAILLAVYNGESYLEEMLESLKDQTWQDFTCYLHDDGSTDGSLSIIRKWTARDGRFAELEGPPTGSAKGNFLWMLGQVEAEYYMFADQDDVWLPEKIEQSMQLILSQSDLKAVFTDLYVTDENLNVRSDSFLRDLKRDISRTAYSELIIDNLAAGCTQLFDRQVRDAAVKLKHPENIAVHDEWVITLAACLGRVEGIDLPLAYYRQHGTNEVGASRETVFHRIARNAKDFASGSYFKRKREFIERSRLLAGELAEIREIPERTRRILFAYSRLDRHPKFYRIRFYKKYNFSRNTGTRWMYLWV